MNTLTFLAPSGAPSSGTIIQQLTTPGNTSGSNFVGCFGAGGPQGVPFAVILGSYQDSTYITNISGINLGVAPYGLAASGELLNNKYTGASSVNIDGNGAVALTEVPRESGTILIRFQPSGAIEVRTQNALFRTVALNAASGVDDPTSIVTAVTVQCYEPSINSSWTQTGGPGALDNRLFLQDRSVPEAIHDFFVGISMSPQSVGEKNDFGFFTVIEFL